MKGFLPGDDAEARVVHESDFLLVKVASPRYLLAMKLYSARFDRDLDDAATLFNKVGFTTADQARDLLQQTYGASLLMPKHDYIVDDVATRATELRLQHTHEVAATAPIDGIMRRVAKRMQADRREQPQPRPTPERAREREDQGPEL